MALDPVELNNLFVYHPPTTQRRVALHEHIRQLAYAFAAEMNTVLPEGRDKDNAIDCIRMAMMWSNAAIACQPPDHEPGGGS